MCNKVDPSALVKVYNPANGKFYYVIEEELRSEKEFINSYSKYGNIRKYRGATVPLVRACIGLR